MLTTIFFSLAGQILCDY